MRRNTLFGGLTAMGLAATMSVSVCAKSDADSASAKVPTGPTAFYDGLSITLQTNRPVVVYDTLPATWRGELDGLVHTFADAVPATLYDNAMGTLKKLATILKTKKTFVLATPFLVERFKAANAPSKAEFDKFYDAMTVMVGAIADSDLKSVETLKKTTLQRLLTKVGPTMLSSTVTMMREMAPTDEMAKRLLTMIDTIKQSKAVEVSKAQGEVVVKFDLPEKMQRPSAMWYFAFPQVVVKVDGSWVLRIFEQPWAEMIQEGQANISQMKKQFSPDNPQSQQSMMSAQMMLGMASSTLDQLEKAKTQEEFDKALEAVRQRGRDALGRG